MGLAAHFACVRLIASTLASLPIHVYERAAGGRKNITRDHPVAVLLSSAPNNEMTSFSMIEAMQAQILNRGKAFAEINFDRKGDVSEIWPIAPGLVEPKRKDKNGPIEYHFQSSGVILPAYKMLHIPGLGFDGINSFSPIQLFRQTFGLSLASEEFGARFFGQGTNVGAVVKYPNAIKDDAAWQRLKTSIREGFSGLGKSHNVMVLEEGATFEKLGMPLEDAQFIESRKFSATEIARIHGVPPHLIGDLEKATFSNIEEQGIEAVIYLFRPWVVRWEKVLNSKLFIGEDKERFYIKFELDGLLRGNIKSRYEAHVLGLQNGILNVDEVRDKEDMNPLPNGQGQIYRVPMNMAEAGNKNGEK